MTEADRKDDPDIQAFLAKIFLASKRGLIAWEETASPSILIAPLEDEYSIKLELVPDLENRESEPDHILSLNKGKKTILRVDRRDIQEIQNFNTLIKENYQYPYNAFVELWKFASRKATGIAEEIGTVNRLLDRKLKEEQ
jgi:hypothetical protein